MSQTPLTRFGNLEGLISQESEEEEEEEESKVSRKGWNLICMGVF